MTAGPTHGVSVVVPVYNEGANLRPLHAEIGRVMGSLGRPWELLLVDDASDDDGAEIMAQLAASDPAVRVITLAARSGQSGALLAGFEAARGETVVTLDADLQNDPADIPRLLEALPGHAAVIGWRRDRHDTWLRRLSSRIANRVRNRLTRETVRDTGCSLKAFRREALAHLPRTRGMHRFLPTLVKLAGGSVVELPVGHRPRHAGQSKYGIGNRLWVGLGDLLMTRWMQRRWVDVRVAGITGRGLAVDAEPPREVAR